MEEMDKLVAGFRAFRATYFDKRPELYRDLVARGQHPKVLVIACSDSRVDPALLLNAEPGELFVVRNVANLVPPHQPDGHYHGTSAAIEFAVRDLKVRHILVLGHSLCGGIQALCRSRMGQKLEREYVAQWISLAACACHAGPETGEEALGETTRATERASIVQSLSNLETFPWIRERVDTGELTLEAWWFDIEKGELWAYDSGREQFEILKI
ncbi:MAG: carbonic anhydrase [Magnetospirillum sp.]|nr:carbonic anhydrase [Magnetospirillum sp.]